MESNNLYKLLSCFSTRLVSLKAHPLSQGREIECNDGEMFKAEIECNDGEMFIFFSLVAALCQGGDGPSSQKLFFSFLGERVSVDPPRDHCHLPHVQEVCKRFQSLRSLFKTTNNVQQQILLTVYTYM